MIFIFSKGLYGQFYGHKLFSIENKSLNAAGIFINSSIDRVFMPTVYYPGDTSTVITSNLAGNNRLDIEIPNFTFPVFSFTQKNGNNYFYGKDNAIENNLKVMKMDAADQTIWQQNFQTDLDFSFPNDIVAIDNHLYITSVSERTEPYHRRVNLKKIDTSGQELWSRNYNSTGYIWY